MTIKNSIASLCYHSYYSLIVAWREKKDRHSPNYVSEVSYQNSSKSSFNHHLITMFARKLAHTTPNSTIMINYDLIVA